MGHVQVKSHISTTADFFEKASSGDAGLGGYLEKYRDEYIVIKFGGEVIAEQEALLSVLDCAFFLKKYGVNVALVHGGGDQITQKLLEKKIKTYKKDGVRVTPPEAIEIIHECMGALGNDIAQKGNAQIEKRGGEDGVRFVGLGGERFCPISAAPLSEENNRSAKCADINDDLIDEIKELCSEGQIPLIHSLVSDINGVGVNVNGDEAAAVIAIALSAERLMLCTNAPGVLDENKQLISELDRSIAEELIDKGVIKEGMIPKVKKALEAIDEGVGGAVILDGKALAVILHELLTNEGAGTLITESLDKVSLAPQMEEKFSSVHPSVH